MSRRWRIGRVTSRQESVEGQLTRAWKITKRCYRGAHGKIFWVTERERKRESSWRERALFQGRNEFDGQTSARNTIGVTRDSSSSLPVNAEFHLVIYSLCYFIVGTRSSAKPSRAWTICQNLRIGVTTSFGCEGRRSRRVVRSRSLSLLSRGGKHIRRYFWRGSFVESVWVVILIEERA